MPSIEKIQLNGTNYDLNDARLNDYESLLATTSAAMSTVTDTNVQITRLETSDNFITVTCNKDVTVCNQNLLTLSSEESTTSQEVHYKIDSDGAVKIFATQNALVENSVIELNTTLVVPPSATNTDFYVLSGCPQNDGTKWRLVCNYYPAATGSYSAWLSDIGTGITINNKKIRPTTFNRIYCYIVILAGTTIEEDLIFKPQLEYNSSISAFAKNTTTIVSANTPITITESTTIFSNTNSFSIEKTKLKLGQNVTENYNNIQTLNNRTTNLETNVQTFTDAAQQKTLIFNENDYSLLCIHHDNFSRILSEGVIGMNSGETTDGVLNTVNNYDADPDVNDRLTINNGATFSINTNLSNAWRLRKIAAKHNASFVVETSVPLCFPILNSNNEITSYQQQHVILAYNVIDSTHFNVIRAMVNKNNQYQFIIYTVSGSSYPSSTVANSGLINNVRASVLKYVVLNQYLLVYMDDQLVWTTYIGDCGEELYLCAHRSEMAHYDFINVFNIANHVTWNPNYILDNWDEDGLYPTGIPWITISAHPTTADNNLGNTTTNDYILQSDITRWSSKADQFYLPAPSQLSVPYTGNNWTNYKINGGYRAEKSIANLRAYTGNLRHLKISFDVFFTNDNTDTDPSAAISIQDVFFQLHDRATGVASRADVPFVLSFKNGDILITQGNTHVPNSAGLGNGTGVSRDIENTVIATISRNEWHRFEIEIKERYDANQHPFTRINIDDKLVFESHVGNCYNDEHGSSPQYGIYKNNWNIATAYTRYFDNFKIIY